MAAMFRVIAALAELP